VPPPLHTLMHIGSGHGQALLAYREAGLKHLVFIESLPQLAQGVSQQGKCMKNRSTTGFVALYQ